MTLPTEPSSYDTANHDEAIRALVAPVLDPLFWPSQRTGYPSAWWGHVPFAHWVVAAAQPRLVVELGTHHGVSYAAFCEAVLRNQLTTRCIAVDTWLGDEHSGSYGQEVYEDLHNFHDARYGSFSQLVRSSFDGALNFVADASVDLLHIDGMHTYEAVRHDFEAWLPKLSKRGVVLFHDTVVRERDFGVWRLWAEVQELHPNFEFLHSHGLGVLVVGTEAPGPVQDLCRLDAMGARRVRERFAALGARSIAEDHAVRVAENAASEAAQARQAAQAAATRIADLTTQLVGITQTREELKTALAVVQESHTVLEAKLTALLSSTSWRVTRPLRGAKRLWSEPDFRRRVIRRTVKEMLLAAPLPATLRTSLLERARRLRGPALLDPGTYVYADWVAQYDTILPERTAAIQRQVEALPWRPKISIVVPVYNTDRNHLEEMIQSVLHQIYQDWELCIADDASTKAHVRELLEIFRHKDDRIKVVYREVNGHISAASNSALELATGDYVALLDHDDILPQHALSTVANAIVQNPTAEIFYSDEDKIDQNGKRFDPYFKPDWNQELLYGQNYINHLGLYRLDLLKRIGGFRAGFEGSQDYDLTLRAVAATNGPIIHIPHILYHWRIFQGAQTFSSTQRDTATTAARRAIQEHLAQRGEQVIVAEAGGGYHRVIRDDPLVWPRVTAVIPTRDHVDILRECIQGLNQATDYPDLEIIVADNDSAETETLRYFDEIRSRGVKIVSVPGTFNYSRINNRAIEHATGEIILLLNNDISMIESGWLKEMVKHLQNDQVAAVGAKLLYPDGTLQHGGVVLGIGGVAGHVHVGVKGDDPGYFSRLKLPQDISCATAACLAVRKLVFDEIGGFDETNLAVAFNDVDLCMRIRQAGHRIIWTPYAKLVHHESKSRGSDLEGVKLQRFMKEVAYMQHRWQGALQSDPFYNPNLSLESCTPQLAFPPRIARPWDVGHVPTTATRPASDNDS
ncbi:glycosyltransferase [Microvirga arabica]|uniref:Glycosyltransferase n=1 Tax=Microvirga arabica TaxID=1128671 RepID=A0ABV6YAQ7_9HYPH